ncbi:MAG: hypothetical protein GX946_08070 [Oligosphaeraceae bacterium]|nr:hypothetical protein [Oligosphaeraceae bacterium]
MPAKIKFFFSRKQLIEVAFWLLITLLIYFFLLADESLALRRHLAIAQSILSGQLWGRQALVGSLEYAPLPSLILLIFAGPLKILPLSGTKLMVALAQAYCLSRLFKLQGLFGKNWQLPLLPVLLVLIFFGWHDTFLFAKVDPGWITAAIYAGFFYHMCLWQHNQDLRHLVAGALFLGLLCLCGAGAIMIAFLSFFIALSEIRKKLNDKEKFAGVPTVLGMPLLYCFALLFIWNWLVMDDVFFLLRDFCLRAGSMNCAALGESTLSQMLFFYLLGLLLLIIAALFSDQSMGLRLLQAIFLLLPLHFLFSRGLQVHASGVAALSGLALLLLFLVFSYSNFNTRTGENLAWTTMLALMLYGFCVFPRMPAAPFQEEEPALVPATALCRYIDQFWPDSRIMLYGLPLASAYPDLTEQRFVARLDFHEELLREQAIDEQMHLLIPPNDGHYYPRKHPILADIHNRGRDWLLLEKQYYGGWQLWRCVTPPKGESKLEFLR